MDYKRVLERAEGYKPAISRFLRDLIALPSESCQEREVILRITQEMETVGFDRIEIDPMGNVLGYIGTGRHLIAMDAHIDNVGVGNPENWKFDPFEGFEDDEVIGGRGASDQTGGMAADQGAADAGTTGEAGGNRRENAGDEDGATRHADQHEVRLIARAVAHHAPFAISWPSS